MKRILITSLLSFLVFGLSVHEATGQSKNNESIPLPEYYGLYALIDGKLCGINVQTASCTLKTVEVKMGRRAGVGQVLEGKDLAAIFPIKAIELRKGIRFVVYQENPTALADLLKLTPMLFIHTITVNTGWPQNVRRSGTEEAWDTGNPSELGGEMGKLNDLATPIQMLVKPLKTGMVLAVPSRELTPGLYHFALGQDIIGNQPGMYFWIGDATEAERLKCVNATYEYSMMLSKSQYAPCGQELKTEAAPAGEEGLSSPSNNNAEEARSSSSSNNVKDGNSSSSDNAQRELIAIKNLWNEAFRLGDKSFFETHLAGNFTYADTGNRRFMDRAKFISKVRKYNDIKSMKCDEYKVSFEGETASISGICYMHLESLFLKTDAKQAFTHKFIKKDGQWLFTSTEEIIMPNR
jgi:hypothetical protein